MTRDETIALLYKAGCKNTDVARYLGLSKARLMSLQRALGLPPRPPTGSSNWTPAPEHILLPDYLAVLRERDMLRADVDILRAERARLIKEGKI